MKKKEKTYMKNNVKNRTFRREKKCIIEQMDAGKEDIRAAVLKIKYAGKRVTWKEKIHCRDHWK